MVSKNASVFTRLRHALLGAPIPSSKAHHERLSPFIALPVFSSDALSSVAYATEAIMAVLILKSVEMMHYQIWISISVVFLIAIVAMSYQQTIHAYPLGGGSYIVATENLGEKPGLVAAGALLIDYILTVSVSVSAGVAAMRSAIPGLTPYIVEIAILFVAIVAWANLRGLRESGSLFAIPTYGFIVCMFTMLAAGVYRVATSDPTPQQIIADPKLVGTEASFATAFILLRSFAAGCTALSGIEAVSDGVQAFRAPEAKNAAMVLRWMAVILATMFIGVGYVAQHLPVLSLHPSSSPEYMTVTAQVAQWAFGKGSPFFFITQFATAAILVLAANTAFADFPRLSSFIARDGYMPRYMARQGDRLVFHNGIIILAVIASTLIWHFHGELDGLLPLYAIGVVTAFTLSQTGMVQHWRKVRTPGWRTSATINGTGALMSLVALIIIASTKFTQGAWMIVVFVPIQVLAFLWVKNRYRAVSKQLELVAGESVPVTTDHLVLLLVPRVNRGVVSALNYAKALGGQCQAVHVTINEKALPDLQRRWNQFGDGIPLVVLPSPFRSLIGPILDYVDDVRTEHPDLLITVIVAEAVSFKWYHTFLTEPVAMRLKTALRNRKNVVVANVRYFIN